MFDSIVIGSGFAGAVVARELAEKKGQQVLVIDARDHVGGNCYDKKDDYGILIHQYGPHIFHTNIDRVSICHVLPTGMSTAMKLLEMYTAENCQFRLT